MDILDRGCSCHISPPCSFCVETYECERCGHRVIDEEQRRDSSENQICDECNRPEEESLMEAIRVACE